MSLRDDDLVLWCRRCRAIVGVAPTPAERDALAAEHDRTAHPSDTPAQTQWTKGDVSA